MAYPPRVCFNGAIYHVVARGDNREAIFLDDGDRQQYLGILRRYKERFHFTLHAYVLMHNHVHLILEPAAGTTVSRIMQCMQILYTRSFNRRHQRLGHVFQGRFRSRLIDNDLYLLVASRYVHFNPVRARLVQYPLNYRWGSYPAYVTGRDPHRLADPGMVLALIDPQPIRQGAGYRDFVEGGRSSKIDMGELQQLEDAIAL